MARRPSTQLSSIIIYMKDTNDISANTWTPRRFDLNSWVTLSTPRRGPWSVPSSKRQKCPWEYEMKAQIKAFRMKPNSSLVESVLVSHAYSFRQLTLDPNASIPNSGLNYLYLTIYEDWQDPRCITDLIHVIHAEVGEAIRGHCTHKQLLEEGIFFYNASYLPPTKSGDFGRLIQVPLPALDSPTWPLPDMATSEWTRARLYMDFQRAMKPKIGSRGCHLSWSLPIHVIADLFGMHCGETTVRKTRSMFIFKPISDGLFKSLMDKGWDETIVANDDTVKCFVIRDSLTFRYYIGREKLMATFQYGRERYVQGIWKSLDHLGTRNLISVIVEFPNGERHTYEIGETWTLVDLREEIALGLDEMHAEKFKFLLVSSLDGAKHPKVKINRREEKKLQGADLKEYHMLQILVH